MPKVQDVVPVYSRRHASSGDGVEGATQSSHGRTCHESRSISVTPAKPVLLVLARAVASCRCSACSGVATCVASASSAGQLQCSPVQSGSR